MENDETINRDTVISRQLVTQVQNYNGDTLKISESRTCTNPSEQPQQPEKHQPTAKTTPTTEQKTASKSAANIDKSVILACIQSLSNHSNGSLVKTNSNKELGTPDNTFMNTSNR